MWGGVYADRQGFVPIFAAIRHGSLGHVHLSDWVRSDWVRQNGSRLAGHGLVFQSRPWMSATLGVRWPVQGRFDCPGPQSPDRGPGQALTFPLRGKGSSGPISSVGVYFRSNSPWLVWPRATLKMGQAKWVTPFGTRTCPAVRAVGSRLRGNDEGDRLPRVCRPNFRALMGAAACPQLGRFGWLKGSGGGVLGRRGPWLGWFHRGVGLRS